MKVMCIPLGISFIAAAVFLHWSCCSWSTVGSPGGGNIFGFIYASTYFGDNTLLAGALGLVTPAIMAGLGVGLWVFASKE